ncbi:uncharacterized protein LOC128267443 isoform X2 [Anopheles cruzii]|uniref:uncharacterized protein LOC128267443 isoform X2 n=1 Tax=Anopheles cruzii TaxID=68878 RepID=UPI0022EC1C8F|nr:uncharacterized protein LOC128267443 isoform X2 [Anopheles cruzii]
MMHPSLEITATPTIPRTPGSSRKSSKTKSDYGGDKKQRKPPISSSDLSVAYGDGTEYSVPGEMTTTSQLKYIDYSPPKTPSAVPKTPEIKLHSSPSPSTSSWISDAGHIAPGKMGVVPEGSVPIPSATGKKQKRPRHKPAKHGEAKRLKEQQQSAPMQQALPMSNAQQPRNPFAMFPGPNVQGSSRPYPDPTSYGKYLNQSLQAVTGLRAPMPFGIFPLPSGPGLIPDTPLFSTAFGTHPGAPGFPMPPNHFGLSAMNRFNEMNLLRLTRPIIGRGPAMGGAGHLQPDLYDEPLDPETKLAQTPLDLQKSTCNVAPLVPPSLQLFPSTNTDACSGVDDESLNLSTNQKLITASMTSKSEQSASQREPLMRDTPRGGEYEMQSKPDVIATPQNSRAHKEDQVVILPAASVLPGASPPQRSKMLVIDIEDSDGSQSTATTSKDGKRKFKEHKKDRKLKEGKLKKKKDKKDKSKGKEREREQLEEQTVGTATSSGMMTMGMIGAEEALHVQLRKERKEKKEKRKDKAKKEKRKERERLLVTTDVGGGSGPLTSQSANVLTSSGAASVSVPKLMLKIGGSIATASPQPDTHEKGHLLAEHGHSATATLAAMLGDEANRDGSPELARISALVTRPPKLKISGASVGISSGKNRKEDSPTKAASGVTLTPGGDGAKLLQNMDESDDSLPTLGTTKHLSGTTNSSTSGRTSPVASNYGDGNVPSRSSSIGVSMGCATNPPNRSKSTQRLHPLGVGELAHSKGASLVTEGSKKVHKESKVSKVIATTTHHQQQTVATSSVSSAPAQMTDVDGNTVWICPACGRVDDGTPMIGCDGCDAWYHWVCVGILVPPEDNEDWYCRVCIGKKQDPQVDERQRKRKKKDKKTIKD